MEDTMCQTSSQKGKFMELRAILPACVAAVFLHAAAIAGTDTAPPAPALPTDPTLKAAGIGRGLCVVVGAADVQQLVSLTNNGRVLVHGITLDDAVATKARTAIAEAGLAGLMSVQRVRSFATLPYNADLVNLLVVDSDALGQQGPPDAEILRVIQPKHGVAWIRKGGQWAGRTKPMPKEMDEWTHFNHGPDNNPVSDDSAVGPMTGIQWTAHIEGGHNNSVGILLANGRWFNNYETFCLPRGDRQSRLDARDAFNGMLLWRRTDSAKRTNHEASVVVNGRRLYGNLADDGIARALDAATGEEVAVYAEAGRRLKGQDPYKPVYPFYHSLSDGILIQTSREKVSAIDTATDKVIWSHTETAKANNCQALAINGGRIFVAFGDVGRPTYGYGHMHAKIGLVICLDLKTGKELWRTAEFAGIRTANFVAHKNVLIF
jgi:hypothetical protein